MRWLAAGLVVGWLGAALDGRRAAGLAHCGISFHARIYALAIAPVTPGRRTSRVSWMSIRPRPASRRPFAYSSTGSVPATQPAHSSSDSIAVSGSSSAATMYATATLQPGLRQLGFATV